MSPIAWFRGLLTARSTVLVALVVLFLGFQEVDRVGAQFPGTQSNTLSILGMTGGGAFASMGGWSGWAVGRDELAGTPAGAIWLYLLLDVVFIVLYTRLLWLGVQRWMPALASAQTPPTPNQRRLRLRRRRALLAVGLLVVADVVEDSLLVVAALVLGDRAPFPVELQVLLATASTLKTAGILLVLLAFVTARPFLLEVGRLLGRALRAVYPQRLSVVVVLVLAALSLLPPWHEVLEQLPDVQRAWVDLPWGPLHFLAASVAAQVLAIIAFLLGRKRAQLYWENLVRGRGDLGEQRLFGVSRQAIAANPALGRQSWPGWRYLIWVIPFATVLVIGLTLPLDRVDGLAFGLFLGVTGGIVVLSLIGEAWLWWTTPSTAQPRVPDQPGDRERVLRIGSAGDILAALVLVVGALGVVRSFGSLAVVRLSTGDLLAGLPWLGLVAVFIVAAVVAGATPRALTITSTDSPAPAVGSSWFAQARREFDPRQDCPTITQLGVRIAILVVVGSLIGIGVLGFLPLEAGRVVGVVAVVIVLLGSITSLLGLIVLSLRRRRPLALFELLGLRSDPVIALVLLIPLLGGQLSGSVALHAVAVSEVPEESAAARQDLAAEFDDWLTRSGTCTATFEGQTIRPLVLVAAEGGGIRAATWTAATLAGFADRGPCAANSVFLSSGVSGGAVGLAVTATLPDGGNLDGAAILTQIERLGASATLPAAAVGLVGSDPLAATTGLRLSTPGADAEWRDRAALVEDSWRQTAPGLESTWDATPTAPTGLIVLDSADILSGCRVVVSQVILGTGIDGSTTEQATTSDPEHTTTRPRCDQGAAEPPLTLDFVDFFGADCPVELDWATAALLSARFPVVTPGGVVDRGLTCGTEPAGGSRDDRLHLVDGGYAENSGLGLIADISPQLAQIVARYNSVERPAGAPLVVPFLVYIQNSPGAYLSPRERESIPELSVPSAGFDTKTTQVTPNSWIQRAMASLGSLCEKDDVRCAVDTAELTGTSSRVVIAAAGTVPSVAVPLGWGLSQATFDQLVAAADRENDVAGEDATGCAPPTWSEYGCVGELLGMFSPR